MPEGLAHAILGASSSKRWLNCPGSIRMQRGIPDTPSEEAELGTAAHTLASNCLLDKSDAREHLGTRIVNEGTKMEFLVDQNMAEAVQVYLDTVRTDRANLPHCSMVVEKRFKLDWLYPDLFGTADCCLVQPWGKLVVTDYKNGAGIYVDVEDNTQAMYYGLGALQDEDVEEVELVIVQPRYCRAAPVRRWSLPVDKLLDWGHNVLVPGAKATEDPDAPLKAGDWCQFCRAAPGCPEIQKRATESAQLAFKGNLPARRDLSLPDPKRMKPADIARVLEFQEIYGPWAKSVQDFALQCLKSGKDFPGYKLVHTRTTRSWSDEARTVKVLSKTLGPSIYQDRKLKSPAQVEKLLKVRNIDKQSLDPLIATPKPGVTIASVNDKRPAAPSSAVAAFKKA